MLNIFKKVNSYLFAFCLSLFCASISFAADGFDSAVILGELGSLKTALFALGVGLITFFAIPWGFRMIRKML